MWGALIGGAASLIGASQSAGAAKSAAGDQAAAAREAAGLSSMEYGEARNNLAPYKAIGSLANNKLAYAVGLDPYGEARNNVLASIRSRFPGISPDWVPDDATIELYRNSVNPDGTPMFGDPSGYGGLTRDFTSADLAKDVPYSTGIDFGISEGTKGINRSFASNGGLDSGAALKALTKFATDYAGGMAAGAQTRFKQGQQQTYNMLSGQQTVGQNAANALAGAGMTNAANAGNYLTQAANATAAGTVGASNAYSGALTNFGNKLWDALSGGGQRSSDGYSLAGNGAAFGAGPGYYDDTGFSQYRVA